MAKLEIRTIESRVLGRKRKVRFLIPDYLSDAPLIVTADGQLKFSASDDDLPYGSWQVDRALQHLASKGLPEPLVVGVDNSSARVREYNPLTDEFALYVRFLEEELLPIIHDEFPVSADRNRTAHMGSSMGGLVSFGLASALPHRFGWALCLSPWFEVEDSRYVREVLRPMDEKPDFRVYMDSGIRDWRGLDDGHRSTLMARNELLRLGFTEGKDFVFLTDTWFPTLDEVARDLTVKEDKRPLVLQSQHTEFHFRRRAVGALEWFLSNQ